ncbi:MAG: serine/threonine-protein kinase [Prochloraceae cyanobacterium]|nr:serine/threonine-protein kinase [Prochloraceae cyanobacterium]
MDRIIADRYQIIKPLGKKPGRKTYLAKELKTSKLVVIKLLIFDEDLDWQDFKLFEREANTLKNLSHPSIPSYLDSFELELPEGKSFAIVQSYIDALSLEEYVTEKRTFSEIETIELARSLLEILVYLHSRQPPVIHRDIKPSNILLKPRPGYGMGRVYLVDFGSVQTIAATTGGTITIVGTYGYMPPEQFGGKAFVNSDLYSLGATLIYLMAGKHPADLPQEKLRIKFESILENEISPSFRSWLKRMTEPSLEKRFKSASEARDSLDRVLEISELTSDRSVKKSVSISRDERAIDILISGRENNGKQILDLGYFWFFSASLAGVCFLSSASLGTGAVIAGIIWILIASLSLGYVFKLLYLSSVRVKIKIDRDYFRVTKKLFGLTFYRRRLFTNAISKLVMTKAEPKNLESQFSKKVLKMPKTRAKEMLKIWVGKYTFELNTKMYLRDNIKPKNILFSNLDRSELNWLTYELSDWLDLPITRK